MSEDKPDLNVVQFSNPNQLQAAVDGLLRNEAYLKEMHRSLARIRYEAYLEYLGLGMDEAKAMLMAQEHKF